MKFTRKKALQQIRKNIATHGWHIYLVSDDTMPRYAYTIGLFEDLGVELVLAGAAYYDASDVERIVNSVATDLKRKGAKRSTSSPSFAVKGLGTFKLGPVIDEWGSLLLGALDYYDKKKISALQILPNKAHWTIDTPRMDEEPKAFVNRAWKWWTTKWDYDVPSSSAAMTNVAALKGAPITEAARWEEDEWEMFAGSGPDTRTEDCRAMPLAVLVATDDSLARVVNLAVGEAVWRDGEGGDWQPWRKREETN